MKRLTTLVAVAFLAAASLSITDHHRMEPTRLYVQSAHAIAAKAEPDLVVLPPDFTPPCNIFSLVEEAHELLEFAELTYDTRVVTTREEEVNLEGETRVRHGWAHRSQEIPVVLLDAETCELGYATLVRNIEDGIPVLKNPHGHPEFRIEPTGWCPRGCWNGMNTPFRVTPPWLVVGLRWKEHVYTPFSTGLLRHFPELAEEGRAHIENDIEEALELLRERRVRSRVQRGQLVADVIEELELTDVLRMIPLLEHTDVRDVAARERDELGYDPFERVFTIVGANGDGAYNASVSAARARGLVQIWDNTCPILRSMYRRARLPWRCISEYDDEPHGHVAGFMGAALHLDKDLERFTERFGERVLAHPELQAMLLAAYNGGPNRVELDDSRNLNSDELKSETRGYLDKLGVLAQR